MTTRTNFWHAPAFLAALMLLCPAPLWSQEARRSPQPAASRPAKTAGDKATGQDTTAKAIVPDILLSKEGSLRGSLIDGARKPLMNTAVVLKQKGKLVASTRTNHRGEYTFANLRSGTFQVEIEKQVVSIRTWAPAAAPAKTLKQLDMAYVPDPEVVRGQFGYLDPVNTSLLLLGIAGVVLGGVAVSEINDLQDDVKKLQSP